MKYFVFIPYHGYYIDSIYNTSPDLHNAKLLSHTEANKILNDITSICSDHVPVIYKAWPLIKTEIEKAIGQLNTLKNMEKEAK